MIVRPTLSRRYLDPFRLQGLRFRSVDNQVRIDGKKADFSGGQVAPPVATLQKIRKARKLAADNGLHTVGSFLAAFLLELPAAPKRYRRFIQA